ncbi:MAG: molybdopterin-dependent oxidoreductase [Chloroflexota bacterium]|nr:molybdopterin-dependent oxidoreductase [Chloroflexota bacterium]
MKSNSDHEPAWRHGHAHEPNPAPPAQASALIIQKPNGLEVLVGLADLHALPTVQVNNCWIISTGHGKSGPFTFAGTRLADVLTTWLDADTPWQSVDVISADGFGTRLVAAEVCDPATLRPILLAYRLDGAPLTREQGLVRLIVPSETDDALRQVKWVGRIEVWSD